MDHLLGLIRRFGRPGLAFSCVVLLALVAALFSPVARAQGGTPVDGLPLGQKKVCMDTSVNPAVVGDCQAICTAMFHANYLAQYSRISLVGYDPTTDYCNISDTDGVYTGSIGKVPTQFVPACSDPNAQDTTVNGQEYCKCSYGKAASGVCNPSTGGSCPASGSLMPSNGASYTWPGIASGGAGCLNGCAVWSEGTNAPGGGGTPYSVGDFYSSGSSCGPSGSGAGVPQGIPKTAEQAACTGATACSGTVNGATVCVACGVPSSTSVSTGSTTTTNSDGSTTTTPGPTTVTSTSDNGNGTSTTTTTTTTPGGGSGGGSGGGGASGGSTTTTTVSTGPTGGGKAGGGSGSGNGTGSGSCTGSTCGDGTDSFGGSCSASFTCDGDAIQCAIAQEQHVRDCSFYQPETAGGTLQELATRFSTAKADGIAPSWSPAASGNASNVSVDFGTAIDQTPTWTSTCPTDQHFSFMGQDVVLPLSGMCVSLTVLGNFLLAVTSLACAGIVFKK